MRLIADEVELGHYVEDQRVEGKFLDARGRVVLLYGGRWNRHYRYEELDVALGELPVHD